MKRTFYFNTGVTPANSPILFGNQIWRGGTKQIPFVCENVPENAIFKFACDNSDLKESKSENFIVREILESDLCSKYAYFWVRA
jgi:hypothetical protein